MKDFTPFQIDKLISLMDRTHWDQADRILHEAQISAQRRMIMEWVKKGDVKVVIAFSGGKDSIAIALYLHFELGIPKEHIELWHHDVDGHGENLFDWACTPSYCQAFADAFGFPLLFSYREGGIVREIYRQNETSQDILFQDEAGREFHRLCSQKRPEYISTRLKFPAVSADLQTRWCSASAKIQVMSKAVNNAVRFSKSNLLICTGERRAESVARSKYVEVEPYKSHTKSRRAVLWRCVLDWSDAAVWGILEKYKVQPHPCYELGWSRCSCQTCIFNSPNVWASLQLISPEKIMRLAAIERETGFTLYKGKTIDQVAAAGKPFVTDTLLQQWGKQATTTFTAPIIVPHWTLPLGAKSMEKAGAV